MTDEFYDRLAPYYHLLFEDWDTSVRRQATQLDGIIKTAWGGTVRTVLDAAAGIGTQTLALAGLGYAMTASDRSVPAIRRCRHEARQRGLHVRTLVTDLRSLAAADRHFDLVLACDNALPHLLSDDELKAAFVECFRCTAPGGGCLVSVRDYPATPPVGFELHPYGVRRVGGTRFVPYQVWAWDGPCYDLALYIIEDRGEPQCVAHVLRTRYYAIPVPRLLTLMQAAGFADVHRIDGVYYQPVLVGTRPPSR